MLTGKPAQLQPRFKINLKKGLIEVLINLTPELTACRQPGTPCVFVTGSTMLV